MLVSMKNPTRMAVNLRKKSISSDSWQEMNDLRVVIRYDTLATVSVTKLGNLPDKARLARLDAFVEEVISLPGVWYVVSLHYFIRDLREFEKEMSKVEVDIAERPVKDTSEGNVALLKGLAMFLEWPDYEFRREYVRYKKSIMYHPKVSRDMLLKSWGALLGRRAPRLDITIYFDDGIYLVFIENVPTYTPQEGKFALGKSKIFFRAGQIAILERIRLETLSASAVLIQSRWRGYVTRKRYETTMKSIRTIQAATRAFLAVRRLHYLQMHRAAIAIQSAYRGYTCRRQYQKLRAAVLAIQAHYRAKVRAWVMKMRYEKSAIIIQKYWRGYLVRKEEIKRRQKIVLVQCCIRRWLARRRLRELQIESRSFNQLPKLNSGHENKIIDLHLKLELKFDRNRLAAAEVQLQNIRAELVPAEAEKRELAAKAAKIEADLKKTHAALAHESEKRVSVEHERDALRQELMKYETINGSLQTGQDGGENEHVRSRSQNPASQPKPVKKWTKWNLNVPDGLPPTIVCPDCGGEMKYLERTRQDHGKPRVRKAYRCWQCRHERAAWKIQASFS